MEHEIAKYVNDFKGFVAHMIEWEGEDGADTWQNDVMDIVNTHLGGENTALRVAVSSGNGVGKSAFLSWLILWFISTRPHPQIVVTANTSTQLSTKTWRELSKWHKRIYHSDLFQWSATRFALKEQADTWFASAVPWSEKNPDAFAGTHEEHVLVVFDEASGIIPVIWEMTEGAMTTPGAMWFAFGNPNRNTGRFYECFNRFSHRWHTVKVDSRTAKMADNRQIQDWVDDYGEDSDFVRVRVRGEFPRSGSSQLFSKDIVDHCLEYDLPEEAIADSARILGVDVARFGDDDTVFCLRVGRKVFPMETYKGLDTMQVAEKLAQAIEKHQPDATFIDGGGVGGGVVDRMKQLGFNRVTEINFASSPDDPEKYANKRAEMYYTLREACTNGLDFPQDNDLANQLIALEYCFNQQDRAILESKKDMKKRGLVSPDKSDALALTYAQTVHHFTNTASKRQRRHANWRIA